MYKNKIMKSLVQCVSFMILASLITTAIMIFKSAVLQGEHGKPDFVGSSLMVITSIEKFLIAVSYLIIGKKMPIKNNILRAWCFCLLIWASNYLPQVMGLAGADGAIAARAFSPSIVICDSIAYFISGIILGILIKENQIYEIRPCKYKTILKSCFISATFFPLLVIIMDHLLVLINPQFGSKIAMGVSDNNAFIFYIIFYSCFIVTGFLLPILYRMTEYNVEDNRHLNVKFELVYGFLLWTPVVMIMVAFGTSLLPTIVYDLAFMIIIFIDTYVIKKVLNWNIRINHIHG